MILQEHSITKQIIHLDPTTGDCGSFNDFASFLHSKWFWLYNSLIDT